MKDACRERNANEKEIEGPSAGHDFSKFREINKLTRKFICMAVYTVKTKIT